jgi:phage-related minor tail protein
MQRLQSRVRSEAQIRSVLKTKKKAIQKQQNKKKRDSNLLKRITAALRQLRKNKNKVEKLSNTQLQALCQWKKGPKDKGITGLNKKELVERYN